MSVVPGQLRPSLIIMCAEFCCLRGILEWKIPRLWMILFHWWVADCLNVNQDFLQQVCTRMWVRALFFLSAFSSLSPATKPLNIRRGTQVQFDKSRWAENKHEVFARCVICRVRLLCEFMGVHRGKWIFTEVPVEVRRHKRRGGLKRKAHCRVVSGFLEPDWYPPALSAH